MEWSEGESLCGVDEENSEDGAMEIVDAEVKTVMIDSIIMAVYVFDWIID